MPAPKWMPRMRPRAAGLRTVTPWIMPGSVRSSTYRAAPVSLARASFRGTALPTKDISERAADLQAGAPETVEKDEGVDADAVGFLGALEPHRVDREVGAKRLGGPPGRRGELLGPDAGERQHLRAVVAGV